MGAIEFIGTIAWPVAVLVVALAYRPLVVSILERHPTRLKAGPLDLVWEHAAEAVHVRRTAPVPAPAGTEARLKPISSGREAELAESNPRRAILEMYAAVEQTLRDALCERGIGFEEGADALSLVRAGESAGLFPAEVTDAIVGVQVLRNLAADAPTREQLEPAKAREYIAIAEGSLYAIRMALRRAERADTQAAA